MIIKNGPPAITYSGNLKDLLLSDLTKDVNLLVRKNNIEVLREVYSPSNLGIVFIKLKQIVDELLSVDVRPSDLVSYTQDNAVADFVININDQDALSFKAIKGGVDTNVFDPELFFNTNFLTWQPQTKTVAYHDPEYLSYFALKDSLVKVKGYFKDSTSKTVDFATLQANKLTTLNVNYGRLISLFDKQPTYVDIWTEVADERRSYVQRYILSNSSRNKHDIYLFQNTLGAVDTVVFTGDTLFSNTIEVNSAILGETMVDYQNDDKFTVTKNTGYLPTEEYRQFVMDFLVSTQKVALFDGTFKNIVLKEHNLESKVFGLNSFEFSYQFAVSSKYKNIYRSSEIPTELEITDPLGELFFLPPRLNEFPNVKNLDSVLIPVQNAYSPTWHKLSFNDFRDYVVEEAVTDVKKYLPHFVTLQGDQVFAYTDNITKVVDKEYVSLTATEYNFTANPEDRKWQYNYGGIWVDIPNTYNALTFDLHHQSAIWHGLDSVVVRYSVGDKYDQITIIKVYSGVGELKVVVQSDYGDIFMNGNIDTTLRAYAYWGGDVINDNLPETAFQWSRISNNPQSDEHWNFYQGKDKKEVHITEEDVFRKAVFECEVTVNF